jgi:hypothetical protein
MEQYLKCANPTCGHVRLSEGEGFGSLQLPLCGINGILVQCVQEALDAHMPDERVHLDERCAHCRTPTDYWRMHRITGFLGVLVVCLNRWSGFRHECAILHSIEATQRLRFKDRAHTVVITLL